MVFGCCRALRILYYYLHPVTCLMHFMNVVVLVKYLIINKLNAFVG
jgi:hypothetical protein